MSTSVDPATLKFPDDMTDISKEVVMFCIKIHKISPKGSRNSRIFLVTEWYLLLLKKRGKRKVKPIYIFRWVDIEGIVAFSSTEFRITFANRDRSLIRKIGTQNLRTEFVFSHPKAGKIISKMYLYISSYTFPDMMPQIIFPEDYEKPEQAPGDVISYLRMKMRRKNHAVSSSLLDSIRSYLRTRPTQFRMTQIPGMAENVRILMEALSFEPRITTVVVPFDSEMDVLRLLRKFLKVNRNITKVVFDGPVPDAVLFQRFAEAFIHLNRTSTNELVFNDSDFTVDHFFSLCFIVRNKSFKAITFKNALRPIVVNPFVMKVEENPGFQTLQSLTVQDLIGLNIRYLLPCLTRVQTLNLVHCDFEIADLFDVLTTAESTKEATYSLVSLNISGNRNHKKIVDDILLPESLMDLVMTDITWDLDSLMLFMDGLSKTQTHLTLDLSRTQLPLGKWNTFFFNIEDMKIASIDALKWNENPMDECFMRFLTNCTSLKMLSLNGCLSGKEEVIPRLIKFISETETLEVLAIAGTHLRALGKETLKIVKALEQNRSIRRLDLRNNKAGKRIMEELMTVMMDNRLVEEVLLDGNEIGDMNSYIDLYDALQKRGTPLIMPWPQKEIDEMLQYGTTTREQVDQAKQLYMVVIRGDSSVVPPPITMLLPKNIPEEMKMDDLSEDESEEEKVKSHKRKRKKEKVISSDEVESEKEGEPKVDDEEPKSKKHKRKRDDSSEDEEKESRSHHRKRKKKETGSEDPESEKKGAKVEAKELEPIVSSDEEPKSKKHKRKRDDSLEESRSHHRKRKKESESDDSEPEKTRAKVGKVEATERSSDEEPKSKKHKRKRDDSSVDEEKERSKKKSHHRRHDSSEDSEPETNPKRHEPKKPEPADSSEEEPKKHKRKHEDDKKPRKTEESSDPKPDKRSHKHKKDRDASEEDSPPKSRHKKSPSSSDSEHEEAPKRKASDESHTSKHGDDGHRRRKRRVRVQPKDSD